MNHESTDPNQSAWYRLEEIRKHAGVSSTNAFAYVIGLKRSENLYQIKKGNHGISKLLANRIAQCYPEVNKLWLMTGEGSMLLNGKSTEMGTKRLIYLEDIYEADFDSSVNYVYITQWIVRHACYLVRYTGAPMFGIWPGNLLLLSEHGHIRYGELHFVEYKGKRFFSVIHMSGEEGTVILTNPLKNSSVKVEESALVRVYYVTGRFEYNIVFSDPPI